MKWQFDGSLYREIFLSLRMLDVSVHSSPFLTIFVRYEQFSVRSVVEMLKELWKYAITEWNLILIDEIHRYISFLFFCVFNAKFCMKLQTNTWYSFFIRKINAICAFKFVENDCSINQFQSSSCALTRLTPITSITDNAYRNKIITHTI